MRIGSSITLIAVGLVLALAVNVNIKGLDLHMIGWILAVVGVIGLVISLALMPSLLSGRRARGRLPAGGRPEPALPGSERPLLTGRDGRVSAGVE